MSKYTFIGDRTVSHEASMSLNEWGAHTQVQPVHIETQNTKYNSHRQKKHKYKHKIQIQLINTNTKQYSQNTK